jgi:murein DD-endopeptidase MepM/ murein hydrolase activator NlpD
MPEEEKKTVDIDTSGPDATIDIEETKDEAVVETEQSNEDTRTYEKKKDHGTDISYENERETKLDEKQDDNKLEEYSKGVQARIGKLTRKLRESERREQAALDYAKGVEESRQKLESKFKKTDSDYIKKFETTISSGLEAAQKELAAAIESGNANAQVEANKRIATLAFENAKLEAAKEGREAQPTQAEKPVSNLSQANNVNIPQTDDPINMDPKAEAWAAKNSWFGRDRAMTYTAFEIHKDLTEKEGFDPSSDDYYAEVDKRIKVDFPHKFGNTNDKQTTAPVQTVASASRSVKPGRKTVRLTSSQVAIAKKLGVPLEEYAKQLKNTKEA